MRIPLTVLLGLVLMVGWANSQECLTRCATYQTACLQDTTCSASLQTLVECNRQVCGVNVGNVQVINNAIQWDPAMDTLAFAECTDSPCCTLTAPTPAQNPIFEQLTNCIKQECWTNQGLGAIQYVQIYSVNPATHLCQYVNGTSIVGATATVPFTMTINQNINTQPVPPQPTPVPPTVQSTLTTTTQQPEQSGDECGCHACGCQGEGEAVPPPVIQAQPPVTQGEGECGCQGEGEAVQPPVIQAQPPVTQGEGECGCQGEGEAVHPPVIQAQPPVTQGEGECGCHGEGESLTPPVIRSSAPAFHGEGEGESLVHVTTHVTTPVIKPTIIYTKAPVVTVVIKCAGNLCHHISTQGEGEANLALSTSNQGEGETAFSLNGEGEGEAAGPNLQMNMQYFGGEGEGEGEGEGYLCGAPCLATAFRCMDNARCVLQLAEMVGCTAKDCALSVKLGHPRKVSGTQNCFGHYNQCYSFMANIKMVDPADIPKMAHCWATKCFPHRAHPLLYRFVQCLNNYCAGGNLSFSGGTFLTISIATFVALLFLALL